MGRPNNVTLIGADKPTVFLHLKGMVLEPTLGNNTFKYGFSFNWDCDPIIPISLWASLLITIFLATILFWALYMISLFTLLISLMILRDQVSTCPRQNREEGDF